MTTPLIRSLLRVNPHPFATFWPSSSAGWFTMISIIVVGYVFETLPFFILYKKAEIKEAWLAFIPIGLLFPYFRTIKKSAWNILWLLSPVVGMIIVNYMDNGVGWVIFAISVLLIIALSIRWQVLFFQAFGMNPSWLLLLLVALIPFFGTTIAFLGIFIVIYIMAFNSRYKYYL